MADLTRGQKATIGWVIFSILFMTVVALATLGTGIYAIIEANKINDGISGEIAYIQKTAHDDGICISIDQKKKVSFIKCNIISNINEYKAVSVDLTAPQDQLISDNNENMKINFQSGITVPGVMFSRTNPDASFIVQMGTELYTIYVSNPLSIEETSAFIFGATSMIDNLFPIIDPDGDYVGFPERYRTYNLFFPGSFLESTPSNQRCNGNLGLQGPSMYVLVKTNNDIVFCYCVSVGSSRSEFCSVPLIENAIVLSP